MLTRGEERQILDRIVEDGLISDSLMKRLDDSDESAETVPEIMWSSRIDRLIRLGHVKEEDITRLTRALLADSETIIAMPRVPGFSRSLSDDDKQTMPGTFRRTSVFDDGEAPSDGSPFEFLELLGEGGMGKVFKARDRRLNRVVALKFISGGSPQLADRFLREARAQARIDHPNVCKVHEVGQLDGAPYIAMQYIDGRSLQEIHKELPLEQKVRLVEDIAEGVHAAHRLGIIHRDIKPTNIMVERLDDGRLRPQIMDFGLARDTEADDGLTKTGVIMGTPAYMSPEQARGDTRNLDRRADIYSLGATLYELLSGHTPFEEASAMDTLLKVISEDAPSPRKFVPNLPADLETIIMKCLEKEPHRRYDSAKALADDLRHWLDGEPIRARQTTWLYAATRKARKHKVLVATVAVAGLIILGLVLFALYVRFQGERQAELARQFGQEAEKIEAMTRHIHMLAPHDVRAEEKLVRARLEIIRAQMDKAGRAGEGPGLYALGRGELALQDFEKALGYLEKAVEKGVRTPELTYALGRTRGELYRRELAAAERIPNRALREARIKEIEKQHGEPALRHLSEFAAERGSGQGETTAYVEGLIAFQRKEYDKVVAKAREAFAQVPWLHEAKRLEGDAHVTLGKEKSTKGDYAGANRDFSLAQDAYRVAAEIGRSDPNVHSAEVARLSTILVQEIYRGGSPKDAFEQATAACERLMQLNPDNPQVHAQLSVLYWRWGEYQSNRDEDPRPVLEKAVEAGEQAKRLSPYSSDIHRDLGVAHRIRARYEAEHAIDPRPSLDSAIRNLNKAIEYNPNSASAWNWLGNVWFGKGRYEQDRGLDPRPSLDQAVAAFRRAVEILPDDPAAGTNLGNPYLIKAYYERQHGDDPKRSLDQAADIYRRATERFPRYFLAHYNLGVAYRDLAQNEITQGRDATALREQAVSALEKALELNPKYADAPTNLATTHLELAGNIVETGGDPTGALDRARAAIEKLRALNPKSAHFFSLSSNLELAAADFAVRKGRNPDARLEQSLRIIREGLKDNPEAEPIFFSLARCRLAQAEWLVKTHGNPSEAVRQGLTATEKVLSLNPENAGAKIHQGKLYLARAAFESNPDAKREAARRAEEAFQAAVRFDAQTKRECEALIREARNAAS